MKENEIEFKQIITKKDVINVLNSMINDKNKNIVNQYIDKILTMDGVAFRQELDKDNIRTVEDIKRFLEQKIAEIENSKFSEIEQGKYFQESKKCTLNDLDMDNTYFHFTDKAYLESIRTKGLVSNIGKHSEGIDKKPSIFFSFGMIATTQGIDVWIKWAMHRMYGEKNQFNIYDGLGESEIKLKQSEWAIEFLNKEYLNDDERKEKAFELIFDSLKEKVFLTIDLKPKIDFSFDDIDYTKQRALNLRENGDIKPYLFMKELYGDYSDLDSTNMEKWNMHTFFGAQIEPERIMQIIDAKGRTDMMHILIEMYEKCKSKDCQFDILDDFILYANQREFGRKWISTKALNDQAIIENIALEDEYEQAIENHQRIFENSKEKT